MNRATHGNNWRATKLLQNDFRKRNTALVHLLWNTVLFCFFMRIFVARKHLIASMHELFSIKRLTFSSIVGWMSFTFLPWCYHGFSYSSQWAGGSFALFMFFHQRWTRKGQGNSWKKVEMIMHWFFVLTNQSLTKMWKRLLPNQFYMSFFFLFNHLPR